MTVDDGTTLDSRQPVVGDPHSEVTRKALATSVLWWNVAASLVLPVLSSAGQPAFALVLGTKSVADLEVDGTVRRSTLRNVLPGGTGRLVVTRTSIDDDNLPDGYELAESLTAWNGQSLGQIGIRREHAERPWQLFQGNDYYLTKVSEQVDSCVVVDTSGAYTSREGPPSQGTLEAFETSRRHGHQGLLLLPHTYATSLLVGRYVDWIETGRAATGPFAIDSTPDTVPAWDPSAPPDPIKYTHPIPVEAEFRVTGLVQNGCWVNPEDLESARSLLQARYDLKLGIWDLVANPTLRNTLLERRPVEPPPEHFAPVPRSAAERADAAVAGKVQGEARAAARLKDVSVRLKILQSAGWSGLDGTWATYPLSESYARWPGQEAGPLVSLILDVGRRTTKVLVRISFYNDLDLARYLEEHRVELEQTAGHPLQPFKRHDAVLLDLPGGWDADVEWEARASEVIRLTAEWKRVLDPLVDSALRILAGTHPQARRALALRKNSAEVEADERK